MRCTKARILLSASLDGELSIKEEQALEKHLSACSACACEMESFTGLQSAMSVWSDEEPSEWLAQSFAYKLKDLSVESAIPVRRKHGWLFGTAAAGLVTVVAAFGLIVHSQFSEPSITLPDNPPVVAVNPVQPDTGTGIDNKPETNVSAPVNTASVSITKSASAKKYNNSRKYVHRNGNNEFVPRSTTIAAKINEPVQIDIASRHAERMIMKNMAFAQAVEGEATVKVTDNLSEASMAMNETVERVRGTLRVAADLMSAEQPVSINTSTDNNGGSML